jgi:hypothetical protein
MTCDAIECPELRLRHSPASDLGLAGGMIAELFRSLLWTLPPEHDPAEFRIRGARLR